MVINAAQWAQIKKYGKTNTFAGKAYAYGTVERTKDLMNAYLSGTSLGGGFKGGAATSTSSVSQNTQSYMQNTAAVNKSTKANNKNTKSTNSKIKSLKKFQAWVEKLFDWIEVQIKARERRIDLFLAKAENAATYQSKNSYVSKAQDETGRLITTNQKGAARYQKQADKVAANAVSAKLVSGKNKAARQKTVNSLISKIQNGTIDISEYGEKTQTFISEYQKWYEKSQDCIQSIEELKQQQKELAQTKLDNIIDQYESIINLSEAAQKTSEAIVDYYTSVGEVVNSKGAKSQIRSQMSQQNTITSNLQAQAKAYEKELSNAAKVFGKNSNEYREAAERLKEINTSLYESKTAYNELNKSLYELDLTRIEYVITNLESFGDKLAGIVSLKEVRGTAVSESDYTKQISNNNSLIGQYAKDRQTRIDMIAKNGWKEGSEEYQEQYEAIMKDEEAIRNLLESNEELKASIVELRWKPFEDLQKKLSDSIDDFDYLRSLMKEESFFDDDGMVTVKGNTAIALIGESMKTARQQVADYSKALEKLEQDYRNGNITLETYTEKSREYIDTIKDSVSAVEDYKDELIDLYTNHLEKANDVMQDAIAGWKELKRRQEDYYDYDKTLKDKTKSVQLLEQQVAALQGVDNAESKAQLARLRAQLDEERDALNETVRDHRNELEETGMDDLSDSLNENLENTLDELKSNSDKQQQVVNTMLDSIKASYSSAYGEIQNLISDTGLKIGQEAKSAVDSLNDVLSVIDTVNAAKSAQADMASSKQADSIKTDKITTGTSATKTAEASANGDTKAEIAKKTTAEKAKKEAAEKEAKAKADAKKKAEQKAEKEKAAKDAAKKKAQDEAKKKSAEKAAKEKADKLAKAKVLINKQKKSSVKKGSKTYKNHFPLWRYVYDKTGGRAISENAQLELGQILGVSGLPKRGDQLTKAQKNKILKALKDVGYKKGTDSVPDDGKYWIHDDEIVIRRKSDRGTLLQLNRGDAVAPANLADNILKWGAINPSQMFAGQAFSNLDNLKYVQRGGETISPVVNCNIEINNPTNQQDVINAINKSLPNITKHVQNEVRKDLRKSGR